MELVNASNGFGEVLPHRVFRLDANGVPTTQVIALRSVADLIANVTAENPIQPAPQWPTSTLLPDGEAGNHFIALRFTSPLAFDSVFASTATQGASGLAGPISVVAQDPGAGAGSGQGQAIPGRAFVGGRTMAVGAGGTYELQSWVQASSAGPEALEIDGGVPGLGFPGTESASAFAGANDLADPRVFVFVADTDGDLSTHETFPANRQIVVRASTALRSVGGEALATSVVASSTVGADTVEPEVASTPPPASLPLIQPGNGDSNVDPSQPVVITFTEPVQPATVGQLANGALPGLSSAVSLRFGPSTQETNVPFTAEPKSPFDLTVWELRPAFAFPGTGPASVACSTFNEVRVSVNANQLADCAGKLNVQPASSSFFTGEGPGVVNAPVAPDAIYVVRGGATPSLSVADLNGFGQGTGDPTFDPTFQTFVPGTTKFPFDPNVRLQGALLYPPLAPGSCTFDGGSAGVFTLTKDSNLDDRLLRSPLVTQIGDVMLGWSLDVAFNNGQEAAGCQGGTGNLCAISGLKLVQVSQNTSTSLAPTLFVSPQNPLVAQVPGGQNPISFAPHPNPPPLSFPPLCSAPFIGGQEPTSIDNALGSNALLLLQNLLSTGDALGNPGTATPPSGLLGVLPYQFFQGPSVAGVPLNACQPYQVRQQVGHFLYVADPARGEIVVLNSNRFTVLDRIPVSDPTEFAMGPNLDFLAVTNQQSDTVSFIDINPGSGSFHQVVKTTHVGRAPSGISWDPGNEDLLVCNEGDNTLSILSAFSFEVRKTVQNTLDRPFDVVITQRQTNFGFQRQVYYGWILNRDGSLSLFESGPNGPNGWGFDDVVGRLPYTFQNPKKIAVDPLNLNAGVWIAHETPLGSDGLPIGVAGGALTNVFIESANFGTQPLNPLQTSPGLRDLGFGVRASIGPDRLTGVPVDIAFDNHVNLGAMPNATSAFSAGFPQQLNGKSYVRVPGTPVGTNQARFLFAAIPASSSGGGAIDVIRLDAGFQRVDVDVHAPGIQSIQAAGVQRLIDYYRQ